MSWISISFETMPKFCDANWTIQSQMVWLLRTECATMRIRIRVRIRFWSIRHLNVTKSKNLIPNFSLNQHNFESSSNHIRLPNMHIAHTHTLCFYSRAKVRQFRYYRARASECIEISSNNAMRKVLWCDQMNIEYRFCSRNEHKNIIAPVLQSLFVRKMAISVRIYVRISYIRPRLWLAWLQSIGSVCFIRNVVVRWTQAQMKVCSVIFCQHLRFMHCNLWPELRALLLWI